MISARLGQIRIRKKGSAGGHNGIKNIIANGTDHFMRVKVGVGEKPKNWDLADYVLSPFTKDERPLVNLAIEHAAKAIEQMLNGDVDAAMQNENPQICKPGRVRKMKALLEPIKEIARFDELFRDLKKGTAGDLVISGPSGKPESLIMIAGLSEDAPVRCPIAENELKAKELYEGITGCTMRRRCIIRRRT